MDKTELIESIQQLNSTASTEFLLQFESNELEEYMEHLLEVDIHDLTATSDNQLTVN